MSTEEATTMQQPSRRTVSDALTKTQRAVFIAVLNRIIPARSDLPGAGDLGVVGAIEHTLAQNPPLLRLFIDGLRAIELIGTGEVFTDCPAEQQDARLCQIEAAQPAFFTALVEQTYQGYYSLPNIQRSIGLSGEPPQPRGHHLAPFDPALLALQRQRAPFWRKAP